MNLLLLVVVVTVVVVTAVVSVVSVDDDLLSISVVFRFDDKDNDDILRKRQIRNHVLWRLEMRRLPFLFDLCWNCLRRRVKGRRKRNKNEVSPGKKKK